LLLRLENGRGGRSDVVKRVLEGRRTVDGVRERQDLPAHVNQPGWGVVLDAQPVEEGI
jgi:hypothetical protein